MAFNVHTISLTYKTEGGSIKIQEETIECDLSINIERDIPAATTDALINVTFAYASMKGWGLSCKKASNQPSDTTVAMTIKTNAAVTPDDTFTFDPTVGIGWSQGMTSPAANPFTADVTAFYVSNSGTANAELYFRAGIDSTPVLDG